MSDLLGSRINGGNTAYGRKESDFYPTPPEATLALLRYLRLPAGTVIWEPACGEGHMAEVFRNEGYTVVASDLVYQGYGIGGADFLTCPAPAAVNWIITNPPFNQAEAFIRRAAEFGVPSAFLLKSQYWHSARRLSLFREVPPAAVCPLTWRPDFLFKTRGRGAPLMDCIWCVWDRRSTETRYIPLERPK